MAMVGVSGSAIRLAQHNIHKGLFEHEPGNEKEKISPAIFRYFRDQ
jgi:hypothetical protein